MNATFVPDRALQAKYRLSTALICAIFFLPWVFFALLPGLGWAFALIYLAANALWVLIALALIPPYYRTIQYEMTDESVIVRRGLITQAEDVVPYRMITNIAVRRGPLDRLFGLGTLNVHTAGHSAQEAGPEAKLVGLRDYRAVQQALLEAVKRAGSLPQVAPSHPLAAEAPSAIRQQMEAILQELRGLRADLRQMHQS